MTLDPDHGFGLLWLEDHEKMELILTERSGGIIRCACTAWNAHGLRGWASTSAIDWILQTVLSPPESEAIGYDSFPEFSWLAEKTEELLFRIGRVFQQDPEMFRLLVYMPKLKEGDTTPDPQTWCNGFVEGMAYNRGNRAPLFATKFGFERIAPILMTSDPDEWEKKDVMNPFTALTPYELCQGLKIAVLAIYAFWKYYRVKLLSRSDTRLCVSGNEKAFSGNSLAKASPRYSNNGQKKAYIFGLR